MHLSTYIYMSALAGQTAGPIMLNIFMETFELGVTYMAKKSFFLQVRFFRKTNFFYIRSFLSKNWTFYSDKAFFRSFFKVILIIFCFFKFFFFIQNWRILLYRLTDLTEFIFKILSFFCTQLYLIYSYFMKTYFNVNNII